jgi:hypothetical protein
MKQCPPAEINLGPGRGTLVPAGLRTNQSLVQAFPQPTDESVLAWRYIDLPRFIDLLAKRKLCLVRLDQFPDALEGSVPRGHYDDVHADAWVVSYYPSSCIKGSQREELSAHHRMRLYATYASCWRLDHNESELAWRAANGGKGVIAIALSYPRLAASVNWYNVHIGCVRYIDYDKEKFPDFQYHSHAYMHKRREFMSEQEVRIIYQPDGWAGRDGRRKIGPNDTERFILVPWDAETLIESIVVSPEESELFASAVRDVVGAFAPSLRERVRTSALKRLPAY